MSLTYGELFAGVGGMTMGFEQAGYEPRWHVEIDRYCQSVLRYHWPDVPVYSDVRTCTAAGLSKLEPVDVIAFGSPCQDLSQAGKRLGFEGGDRSSLFYEAIRIIKEMRDATNGAAPRWAVWENVRGALDSHDGADFAAALEALADAGALVIEWAKLDAQFFGVPQRRERVFAVACFDPGAAGRCPDPLLPLAESSPWNPRSRGKAGAASGGAAADGAALYAGGKPAEVANARTSRQGQRMPSRLDMSNVVVFVKGRRATARPDDADSWREGIVSPTLTTYDNTGPVRSTVIAVHIRQDPINGPISPAMGTTSGGMGVLDPRGETPIVRRLTPTECERLMGWPDGHTARGDTGPISDNQRGKMIGNGVATPVAEFIARSIREAEEVT